MELKFGSGGLLFMGMGKKNRIYHFVFWLLFPVFPRLLNSEHINSNAAEERLG
jgi:hypothetical protein